MDGRIFELTPEEEIVWEYVNPFLSDDDTPTAEFIGLIEFRITGYLK